MRTKPAGVSLFATPDSWTDLTQRIELLNGSEKQIAWTYAMMAWNLAMKLMQEEIDNAEADTQD